MSEAKTLKDVLKPPFTHDGDLISDRELWLLQNFGSWEDWNDSFFDFVCAALNEKYERDFGEQIRMEKGDEERNLCPECSEWRGLPV